MPPYLGWEDAVGASGTIKAVGLTIKAAGLGSGEVTAEGLAWLKRKLFKLGDADKIDFEGIKPDRRAIFPAGLAQRVWIGVGQLWLVAASFEAEQHRERVAA